MYLSIGVVQDFLQNIFDHTRFLEKYQPTKAELETHTVITVCITCVINNQTGTALKNNNLC